jgi:hypothetical protein
VKRELRNIVIIGIVDTGVAGVDQLGFESGRQFQNVPDTLSAAGGGSEAVVAVELDVDVVFEVFPLLFGEQRAERRGTKTGIFIGAEILHR